MGRQMSRADYYRDFSAVSNSMLGDFRKDPLLYYQY